MQYEKERMECIEELDVPLPDLPDDSKENNDSLMKNALPLQSFVMDHLQEIEDEYSSLSETETEPICSKEKLQAKLKEFLSLPKDRDRFLSFNSKQSITKAIATNQGELYCH